MKSKMNNETQPEPAGAELSDGQREGLETWLFHKALPYDEVLERCDRKLKVRLSLTELSQFDHAERRNWNQSHFSISVAAQTLHDY